MSKSVQNSFFVITYRDPKDGQTISLKARKVVDSSLGLSFIAISDFIFESGKLVVNPAEEDLKKRYAAVKTIHISIYSILSIEELGTEHKGLSFKKDKSNLFVLPGNTPPPQSK